MSRMERWLTGIAVTGLASTAAGVALFWMLLTTPERAATQSALPQQFLAMTHWAWHLVARLAEWL